MVFSGFLVLPRSFLAASVGGSGARRQPQLTSKMLAERMEVATCVLAKLFSAQAASMSSLHLGHGSQMPGGLARRPMVVGAMRV